jgi:Tol biopolymer transport system component
LAELVAANPTDAALWSRLERIRHDHAPLLYSRDDVLYLAGPDGEDGRLLFDAQPASWPVWSPDRSQIAFYSTEPNTPRNQVSLFVWSLVTPDAAPRRLADQVRSYAAPVWSPDGRQIAFVSQAPTETGTDPSPRTVRIVNVATGVVTDLTGDRLSNAASPSWSPDGSRLVVVSRQDDGITDAGLLASGEVYVIALATGAIENVGQGRISGPWRAAWSPAVEAIIVQTRSAGMSYDADRSSLYLIEPSTGRIEDLNPRGEKVSMPIWSPDGLRYAYVVDDTTIRVRDLGGTATWTTLDRAVNGALTWSPGGEAIFALGPPGGASYRILLGAQLGQEQAVTLAFDPDTRQAGTPQWSAINPSSPPTPATTGGTAFDPVAAPAGVLASTGEAVVGAR